MKIKEGEIIKSFIFSSNLFMIHINDKYKFIGCNRKYTKNNYYLNYYYLFIGTEHDNNNYTVIINNDKREYENTLIKK